MPPADCCCSAPLHHLGAASPPAGWTHPRGATGMNGPDRQPSEPAESDPSRGARLRAALPHGGTLPDAEWRTRHRVIVALLCVMIVIVAVYAVIEQGSTAGRYAAEFASLLAFLAVASWAPARRASGARLRSSMGLLTASATLVDISGGLTEMHFTFFVVIVVLTLYEDWLPFLLAVAFVLIHHGVIGTLDPQAVFSRSARMEAPVGVGGAARHVHGARRRRGGDRLGVQRARARTDAGDPAGARAARADRRAHRSAQPPQPDDRPGRRPPPRAPTPCWRSSTSTASRSTTTASVTRPVTAC